MGGEIWYFTTVSKEDIKPYTEMMLEHFEQFEPIYIISGDTDFPTETVTDYYLEALETVSKKRHTHLKFCIFVVD